MSGEPDVPGGDALPAPADPAAPVVRASDAEREAAVQQLSAAVAEGRLTLAELGARADRAYGATTRQELDALVADLPVSAPGAAAVPAPKARRRWIVSVLGDHRRAGRWRVTGRTAVVSVLGSSTVDLRDAVADEPDLTITSFVLLGDHRVIVPRGIDAEVTGFVLLGDRQVNVENAPARPGAPRVHVRVVGLLGSTRVESG